MLKTINCKNCDLLIEVDHGNTKHCELCKKIVKSRTTSSRYARVSLQADPCWLNEKILRKYYGVDMDPDILESEGFDFERYAQEIIVNDEKTYYMKKFGFSILKNKKIQIWKTE